MEYLISDREAISESIEMYLLRIALLQREGQPVPLPLLAHELAVSSVSANEMSRKLVDRHLIEYEPYKGVTLTVQGERLARRVLRCRRLWEVFFANKLGIEPYEAEVMACRFEHVTPEALAEYLAAFLEHPAFSPQHEPIPYDDQIPLARPAQPLTALVVGARGRVAGLRVDETTKNFLHRQGLWPGVHVVVLAVAADGGLLLEISGQRLSLAPAIAGEIDIIVDD